MTINLEVMDHSGDSRVSADFECRSEISTSVGVFQEDWWLSAASLGRFEKSEVVWEGVTVASLAYVRQRKMGLQRLRMPPYARTLGPVLRLPPSKPVQRGQSVRRAIGELLTKLPPHDNFQTTLDPADESALAFVLAGARIDGVYTFRVPPSLHPDGVLDECDRKTRGWIRSNSKRVSVVRHWNLQRFIAMSERENPGNRNIHDFPLLESLFATCVDRNATIILSAVDEEGRDIATTILLWGGHVMFAWLRTRDRALSNAGSGAVLLWEAIQMAHERGMTFDFDGFNTSASGKFLASFGRPPVMRPQVVSSTWRYQALELFRKLGA